MNINPAKAYVYQPYPPTEEGKFYGVSGPDSLGFAEGNLKGVSWKDANEIARVCNENPEFAADFVRQIKERMKFPDEITDCGCKFESVLSNAVLLCDNCDREMEAKR